MKLSKAQQNVIDTMKQQIDEARTLTLKEWVEKNFRMDDFNIDDCDEWHKNYYLDSYEGRKAGYALTVCNSRTLYKLQELGLVEIIEDSNGKGSYNVDTVKLLNY